jgi:O-antigen/teichoic acid export membrane protein
VASGSAALVNVVLNIILIPRFGILGAAYSTLASNLTIMLITNIAGYNFFKLKNVSLIIILTLSVIIPVFWEESLSYFVYYILCLCILSGGLVYLNYKSSR